MPPPVMAAKETQEKGTTVLSVSTVSTSNVSIITPPTPTMFETIISKSQDPTYVVGGCAVLFSVYALYRIRKAMQKPKQLVFQ
jgi:hypothetical protein